MARIRTIKPEFWHDEKVGALSIPARLFFIGLWNFADDSGRIGGVRRVLRGLLFPFDDNADIDGWVGELVRSGMVREYRVAGKQYLEVVNFNRHQKIDKRAKSWIPGPESADPAEDVVEPADNPVESPEDWASDLSLNLGSQPQSKEHAGDEHPPAQASLLEPGKAEEAGSDQPSEPPLKKKQRIVAEPAPEPGEKELVEAMQAAYSEARGVPMVVDWGVARKKLRPLRKEFTDELILVVWRRALASEDKWQRCNSIPSFVLKFNELLDAERRGAA